MTKMILAALIALSFSAFADDHDMDAAAPPAAEDTMSNEGAGAQEMTKEKKMDKKMAKKGMKDAKAMGKKKGEKKDDGHAH